MNRKYIFLSLLVFFILIARPVLFAAETEAPRITAGGLKDMLGNPDLVIIDVRTESEWKKTDLKIRGAVWEYSEEVESWAKKYPENKVYVLYCS
jgi:hypothetical protein